MNYTNTVASLPFFLFNMGIALLVVTVAVFYLRHTTRRVIRELCLSDAGAEFWLRSADILAYTGTLILVMLFGDFKNTDWVESLRITLVLTLAGLFVVVLFVSANIWSTVKNQPTGTLMVKEGKGE